MTIQKRELKTKGVLLAGFLCLALVSCSQDSLFYQISNETAPKEPLIRGGPSQIVVHSSALYVARKYIYKYEYDSVSKYRWERFEPTTPPDGDVIDIASAGTSLFVLTMKNWDAYSMKLWKSDDGGGTWAPVANGTGYNLENIYGGGNTLFAGAFTGTSSRSYGVLYYDSINLVSCTGVTGRLAGAAQIGSTYYVAAGSTVYSGTSLTSLSAVTPASFPGSIAGIIEVGGKIAVATVNGHLYQGGGVSFTRHGSFGGDFTGALTVFYETDGITPKFLLLGTESDSSYYTYGYREVSINGSGELTGGFNEPGEGNSSIANRPRYRASLGRRVIRSIIQTPRAIDTNQPLFASTQSQGLWRYYRSKEEWNADDNSDG
jgi:hypothetical protein